MSAPAVTHPTAVTHYPLKTAGCRSSGHVAGVAVTEAVCTGSIRNAIAVVRPPGHHAEEGCCMGFSLYNNVAIAASVARKKFDVPRVLIVDWVRAPASAVPTA